MASNLGIDGLSSGMNTTAIIEQLMAIEAKPLYIAETRKAELKTKDDAWRDVNSRVFNLREKMSALKSSLTFKSRSVKLGTEEYFTATANTGAAESTYNVEVVHLAKAHVVASRNDFTSGNTSLNYEGTFEINGQSVTINSSDTLSSIADKVNNTKDIGVTASVIKLADDQFQMTLTSKKTGVANSITAVDNDGILQNLGVFDSTNSFANTIQSGQDARIIVNGLTVNRSTNTINDVISGVTLNLKKAGNATMQVESDLDKVVEAVKGFVDQYNSTMSFIKDSLSYDAKTNTKGALFGESSLVYIQSEIRGYLSKTVSSAAKEVNSLTMIGISTGGFNQSIEATKSGQLSLDETKLRKALEEHFDDVMKLFGATVTNVASSENGGSISASSQLSGQYPVTSIIDGRTGSDDWGNGGGWSDNTSGVYPDWVEISFNGRKTIDSLNIHTLNSEAFPADTYGVRNLTFEYWDETTGEWKTLKSAEDPSKELTVTDNTKGFIGLTFESVTTSKVRINITETNGDNDYSRLTEIEVFQKNDGIFSNLHNKLWDLTRTSGMIATRRDAIKSEQKSIDKRIERLEDILGRKEALYRARFNAMEQALSKIQTQTAWLSNQLAQMPNYSSNK